MSGGHVLTQNQFLKDVNLESILKDIDELIIGISAGSMNSAKIVYCQPELEGEVISKDYQLFLKK